MSNKWSFNDEGFFRTVQPPDGGDPIVYWSDLSSQNEQREAVRSIVQDAYERGAASVQSEWRDRPPTAAEVEEHNDAHPCRDDMGLWMVQFVPDGAPPHPPEFWLLRVHNNRVLDDDFGTAVPPHRYRYRPCDRDGTPIAWPEVKS